MVDSSKEQRQKFKINDLVSIKIDKVDKSTLHPNLLMAKIVSVDSYSNYVQIVTPFGRIKGAIASNRLNHCTATNVTNLMTTKKYHSLQHAKKQQYHRTLITRRQQRQLFNSINMYFRFEEVLLCNRLQ